MDYFIDEQRFKSMTNQIKAKHLNHDDKYTLNQFLKKWKHIKDTFNNEIYETHEDMDPEGDAFLREQEELHRKELLEDLGEFYKRIMRREVKLPEFNPPARKKKTIKPKSKRKIIKKCKCK